MSRHVARDYPLSFFTSSEILWFSHSLGGSYGLSNPELAQAERIAKALNCDLEANWVDGAVEIYDDSSNTSDGGWANVWTRLTPTLTAAPYIAQWPACVFFYGINTIATHDTAAATLLAIKASLRGMIGRARCAAIFEDGHASMRLTGTGEAGVGGWTNFAGSSATNSGTTFKYTATVGDEVHIDVPADYPGDSAIWLFTLTGGTGNGGAFTVDIDGTPYTQAGVTYDTRNLHGPGAVRIAGQAWRIPIAAAGAHEVTIDTTAITGAFYVDAWGIEAEVPPWVILPLQPRCSNYTAYTGYPFPPDDTKINTLRTAVREVAAEHDRYVLTSDADGVLNKQAKHFHSDGVHLSTSGHEISATSILQALARALPIEPRVSISSAKKGAIPHTAAPWHTYARVASTANVTLSAPGATIDGITLNPFDRVLLKNQTNAAENGIYLFRRSNITLTRVQDYDSPEELVPGSCVWVSEGSSANRRTAWAMFPSAVPTVVGTTLFRFTRIAPDLMLQPQRSFWTPGGAGLENMPRSQVINNTLAAPASGTMRMVGGIVIPAGEPVSNVTFVSGTTGGATLLDQWAVLYHATTLAMLSRSANGTSGAWGATTSKTFALTTPTPYTPNEDTPVYVALVTRATTNPTLTGTTSVSPPSGNTPILYGTSTIVSLGATPPSTAGAISAVSGVYPYVYLS